MDINKSPTLIKYKNRMRELLRLYYPTMSPNDIDAAIDYSINKRIYNANAKISNSYKRYKTIVKDPNTGQDKMVYKDLEQDTTLLTLSDYIETKKPIVTPHGVLFYPHDSGIPNPLLAVVQSFLDLRGIHKKEMFKYDKGTEQFNFWNLQQSLNFIWGLPTVTLVHKLLELLETP